MKTTRFDQIPQPDGRRRVWFLQSSDGSHHKWKHVGWLMPEASQKTLEASPGIQSWSHPRGKVATVLQDGGASILSFSDYCKRHLIPTYPHTCA